MNSKQGKHPTKRAKQPTRRSVKQRRTAPRAAAPPPAARPKARAKAPSAAPKGRPAPRPSNGRLGRGKPQRAGLASRIASSRPAMAAIAVACALVVVGAFDTAANWGKAYGNVTVNGVDVGGMTADEMREALKGEFGSRVSHAQVTIYADEEAQAAGTAASAGEDLSAVAEELSYEEADEAPGSWQVDALSLKAEVPYDRAIDQALQVGRGEGGIAKRLGLLVGGEDVALGVEFDEGLVEQLAAGIDLAIGDPCVDATVEIVDGQAQPVEGRPGQLVDREWLANTISRAMISGDVPDSFVAEASEAQSRISDGQAADMADSINRAISEGVLFSYRGRTWLAGPAVLGDWTQVSVAGEEGSWHLEAAIDPALALPVVVGKVGAAITSDDIAVTFEESDSGMLVHTAGEGSIPEATAAMSDLQSVLYGENGVAWGGSAPAQAPTVEVGESSRPETLSFDDAVNLGVVTVVGEYTTEFSDVEGTENRNHNIKLAADILDGYVVGADGGTWSFNDIAGDTDEEAGFWTAGSIVDGEIVDSVGGGICQVATTVFNSVLEAGLEVLERHNHTMYMSNYPTGRDAAIDYPTGVDLRWANGLESDVLLRMSYTDTSVTARLYSVRTGYSSEYEQGDWEDGEKYVTLFEEDDSLGEGDYYRKTVGEDGAKVSVTRYVTDDQGKPVRTDLFQSVYEPKDEVYVVGPGVDTAKLERSDD